MGQIMLGKHNKESVGSVAELLPTINPGIHERRLDVSPKRSSSSLASTLLVILSIIFAVSALKQICDLREQNLSLMQQLAFERQKDAALKLAVRENVPEDKFMQHVYSPADAGRVEDEGKIEQPRSTWSINLSVLWTSPTITPCDMSRLAKVLAKEIYQVQEDQGKTWEQKKTKEENMMEQSELSNLLEFEKMEADEELLGESVNNKENSSEESKENITELSDLLNLIQSHESAENKEESSEESEENITKEISDLLNLIQSDYDLLNESIEDEDTTVDYYLSNPAIYDEYDEYDLLGSDSAEQDYYNYY